MKSQKTRQISLRGHALIREPLVNKGSAFTAEERAGFGLEGLLPFRPVDIKIQAARNYEAICRLNDPLEKYVALAALQDRNEHLYFYLLREHLEEYLPIVYTPTVGLATQRYSHVFQRGRGVWITPADAGRVRQLLRTGANGRDIRLIVVTDNESILGIGDQGAGGMAISIGKLSLYTAGAGIDPATVLPISLDVGTNNETLLEDERYLGWPERRIRGDAYLQLLDEFVAAVNAEFPGAMLQWEDFRKDNALRLLDRYRNSLPSFNDDIQGTGATALAGIYSAARVHGRALADEKVVILGAGAAGLGIFRQIRSAMAAHGLSGDALDRAIAVLDSKGLLIDDGSINDEYKKEMAWPAGLAESAGIDKSDGGLEAVCKAIAPTILIGTSGQRGAFTETAIKAMAPQPVVMPLSNPTNQSEATPEEIYQWIGRDAFVATGSPFADVKLPGGEKRKVGQGNNAFIFPGVGLGAIAAGLGTIDDETFHVAARALAQCVRDDELATGLLFPPIHRLREVSARIASEILAKPGQPIEDLMWSPDYERYEPADR